MWRGIIVILTILVSLHDLLRVMLLTHVGYSQCIPGTGAIASSSSIVAPPTTLTTKISSTSPSATNTEEPSTSPTTINGSSCTGTFTPVTAASAYAGLDPGWNLGNTLDAVPDEGSWNNPAVTTTTLSQIQEKGFRSIRIPGM